MKHTQVSEAALHRAESSTTQTTNREKRLKWSADHRYNNKALEFGINYLKFNFVKVIIGN